jgi:predicted RNase H-like HicB family nuclease
MHNEFTAIIERDGPWYVAYCAEVPGANGQGTSHDDCLANLREAIAFILQHRREESLRSIPPDAAQELVIVGGSATGSSATCGGLRKLSVPDPPG